MSKLVLRYGESKELVLVDNVESDLELKSTIGRITSRFRSFMEKAIAIGSDMEYPDVLYHTMSVINETVDGNKELHEVTRGRTSCLLARRGINIGDIYGIKDNPCIKTVNQGNMIEKQIKFRDTIIGGYRVPKEERGNLNLIVRGLGVDIATMKLVLIVELEVMQELVSNPSYNTVKQYNKVNNYIKYVIDYID